MQVAVAPEAEGTGGQGTGGGCCWRVVIVIGVAVGKGGRQRGNAERVGGDASNCREEGEVPVAGDIPVEGVGRVEERGCDPADVSMRYMQTSWVQQAYIFIPKSMQRSCLLSSPRAPLCCCEHNRWKSRSVFERVGQMLATSSPTTPTSAATRTRPAALPAKLCQTLPQSHQTGQRHDELDDGSSAVTMSVLARAQGTTAETGIGVSTCPSQGG